MFCSNSSNFFRALILNHLPLVSAVIFCCFASKLKLKFRSFTNALIYDLSLHQLISLKFRPSSKMPPGKTGSLLEVVGDLVTNQAKNLARKKVPKIPRKRTKKFPKRPRHPLPEVKRSLAWAWRPKRKIVWLTGTHKSLPKPNCLSTMMCLDATFYVRGLTQFGK